MNTQYNPFSLSGKTILVTGASSGIGRATSIECSKLGAKLVITARNKERLEQTFNNLEGSGHKMILCDLSDHLQVDSLLNEVDSLNGLVNNAGIGKITPLQFIDENDFHKILQVNTVSPLMILSKLVKKKKLVKGSSVVFTSSIAGLGKGGVGDGMYSASKGAISSLIHVASNELTSKRIRINAVCPAMIETEMNSVGTITEEQYKENMKHYPLGRWGKPEEVAWAIIYLLSDASSFTTGTNLLVNGGI